MCRKRDPNAKQAWWDDVRIKVRNIVFKEAPELEKCLTGDSRSAPDKVANPYPAVNEEEAKDNTRRIKPLVLTCV